MGKNPNIGRWVKQRKAPSGHSHPLIVRSNRSKNIDSHENISGLRLVLVFIKELVVGRVAKGEHYPERVYFRTTYPDVQLKEVEWYDMLAVSTRYLVQSNQSRKKINFKKKLITRNGRHKKSK